MYDNHDSGDKEPDSVTPDRASDSHLPAGDEGSESDPSSSFLATANAPRFCRQCGMPWNPEWTSCPTCVARTASAMMVRSRHGGQRAIGSALALYFVMLLSTIVGSGLFEDGASAVFFIEGMDTLAVGVWVVIGWRTVVPGLLSAGEAKWYVIALGLAVMTFVVASVSTELLVQTLRLPVYEITPALLEGGYGWRSILLTGCLQPAIVEELAFRGVILSGMQRILHQRDAILVSALLFMTIHLTVPSFPHLFLIGVILGYLRTRTGSLYPCMLMHFAHNLLCVLTEVLPE